MRDAPLFCFWHNKRAKELKGLNLLYHTFFITNVPLVPPKPKEFDMAQVMPALSLRSRTIGMSAKSGSRVSICADAAMKSPCIISNV